MEALKRQTCCSNETCAFIDKVYDIPLEKLGTRVMKLNNNNQLQKDFSATRQFDIILLLYNVQLPYSVIRMGSG